MRELRNLVGRLAIMAPEGRIGREQVREALPRTEPTAVPRLADATRAFEREQIEAALAAANGNMTEAASRLGLERSHLYKKLKKLGVRPPG